MLKRVLITSNRDDVHRILDLVPFTGAYVTNSTSAGTITTHYSANREELARVTQKAGPDGCPLYTVRLAVD